MKIINMEISALKPYEKNAKKHPQKQIDILAKNIERFGFTTPVLIDKDFVLIAGHGRVEAMKKLGRKEVPAVVIDYLTPDEVKALRKADNKIAELGEWDMELVIEDLQGLDIGLLDLTGFDKEIFDNGSEQIDIDVPSSGTGLEQITFTLTPEQAEIIREALDKVRKMPEYEQERDNSENLNSNGNAVAAIIRSWTTSNS